MKEIERKYLLRGLPSGLSAGTLILQGYLSTGDPEIRLRAKGTKYFLTRKSGNGLVRTENELEISKDVFEILWPMTENARVEKIRFQLAGDDGLIWEIDRYCGPHNGLYVAEVELPDAETEAEMPEVIVDVLYREVTGDSRLQNKALATSTAPCAYKF